MRGAARRDILSQGQKLSLWRLTAINVAGPALGAVGFVAVLLGELAAAEAASVLVC